MLHFAITLMNNFHHAQPNVSHIKISQKQTTSQRSSSDKVDVSLRCSSSTTHKCINHIYTYFRGCWVTYVWHDILFHFWRQQRWCSIVACHVNMCVCLHSSKHQKHVVLRTSSERTSWMDDIDPWLAWHADCLCNLMLKWLGA